MFAVMCWDFYSPSASTSDEKSSLDLGIEQFLIEQDGRMATAFNQTREWYPKNSIFEQFMIYVIKYGKDFFWIPAGILLSLLVGWTGRKTAATMALSFIIAALIVIPAKDLVGRERPTVDISGEAEKILEHRSEYSFPSGHASLVSAGTIVSLILFRGTKWKTIGSILLAVEAAVVSFAQVYMGVHHFSDILGGIIIGSAAALLSLVIVGRLEFVLAELLIDKFLLHAKVSSMKPSEKNDGTRVGKGE